MKFRSKTLEVREIEPGIIELVFCSSLSANLLDVGTLKSLKKALHIIQSMVPLHGVIFTSDKNHFILGADINEFLSLFELPQKELSLWLSYANQLFSKFENLPVPTVSAINGYALGGGCEFILASDYRVADNQAFIGLPETKLGIMPGFGGTVRLPRLIGLERATNIMARGSILSASCCKKIGLVDEVVSESFLAEAALSTLKEAINNPSEWKKRRHKKQTSLVIVPKQDELLQNSISKLEKDIVSTHYPAVKKLIRSIEKSHSLSIQQALDVERSDFLELATTSQAKALVRVYLNDQFVKAHNRSMTSGSLNAYPTKIGVLGADIMGTQIALLVADHHGQCYLNDLSESVIEESRHYINKVVQLNIDNHNLTAEKQSEIESNIDINTGLENFSHCDVVIDVLTHKQHDKPKDLRLVEDSINPTAILASYSSDISIDVLAQELARPEQFCGIHFLYPTTRVSLVEIIKGSKTSDNTIKQAIQFTESLGKIPIVVNDKPGFFIHRILVTYLITYCNLVSEGVRITDIDFVMEREFGWHCGPGKILDKIGLDSVYQAYKTLNHPRLSLVENNILESLIKQGKLGQKTQNGFYTYRQDSDNTLSIIEQNKQTQLKAMLPQEIIDRMMFPMMNEVVRCLEEEVILTPEEGDAALVHGIGFPSFQAGVFHLIDQMGVSRYIQVTQALTSYGAIYEPPALLKKMSLERMAFYPRSTKQIADLRRTCMSISVP
ncbi:3-hydroxyacyl-CoA dehydrogenase NAD-binding domain-containing protein [Vibrio viridaestus]|uniref:enoyl-CoA hydratase n=1 Tax=Vibrio viridaestus TaxID=2487322 RepID=A0A3N9TWC8_9VIBR|nr:3-hydroxyacyl-CoA dehydrogenase NAD-binding domain-containing protein [Vibrio viridaestus]RQW61222.1 fatty acid oxidation complex subunit alpha FadB [Vibrio viridaestus]